LPTNQVATLSAIKRFDQLVAYLRDEMGWPVGSNDFEELTFEYTPEELGIDTKNAAKIQEIKRLRPLAPNQPWGIFFIKFEPRKLPVVALRRILSQVALKKRGSANRADRRAWSADDLLFISNYGEGDARRITFAHFSSPTDERALPVLKVIDWDDKDTPLHLEDVSKKLTVSLAWPDSPSEIDKWKHQWRSAFVLRHREIITTAQRLSIRLAELARDIRDELKKCLAEENDLGRYTRLMGAFKQVLVHDLDAEGFADMYAQTIAYGLLSARISHPKERTADDFSSHMRTNPFLREMMESFLHGANQGGAGIDFDELGVSEVVELLDDANMEAVVRDFDDRNPLEDPVIHFYEEFLRYYDPSEKKKRGVFYTPRPIVSYIVRSADELLRTEFDLADGLADTTSWGEMVSRRSDLKIPDGISPGQDFVQILDPAAGTGTFLVEVIDLIHKHLFEKWRLLGHPNGKVKALWNAYVAKHLLPRLHGYELLMAPYAIAHLKLGLKLYETGYRFGSDERARVYLTNTLEPANDVGQMKLEGTFPALAHEALAVSEIKRTRRFTVIVGNPPYSNFGQLNKIPFVDELLEDYKRGLGEKKLNLDDDFIKFFRLGHHMIAQSGCGILGLITSNAYLYGITHRRMRELIQSDFPLSRIVDLHGNARKEEVDSQGRADQNVFDIMQGVCIGLFSKAPWIRASVNVAHLQGPAEWKYSALLGAIDGVPEFSQVAPQPPYFLFRSSSAAASDEYEKGVPLSEVFRLFQSPIQTKRDGLTIHFNEPELQSVLRDLKTKSADTIRKTYQIAPDGRDWKLDLAIADIKADAGRVVRIAYKPFDFRYTYFTGKTRGFVAYPRTAIMKHMLDPRSRALVFKRQARQDPFGYTYFLVIDCPCSEGLFAIDPTGREFIAPMLLLEGSATEERSQRTFSDSTWATEHNFTDAFLARVSTKLQLPQRPDGLPESLSAETLFYYIYAIVSSRTYRERFQDYLYIDYPRIPIPRDVDLLNRLASLGGELANLQTAKGSAQLKHCAIPVGAFPAAVELVKYESGSVWLDKKRTKGFSSVPQEAWEYFVGGYRVCDKWLKERKGRELHESEILHFRTIVSCAVESRRLTMEIDHLIATEGGWSAAFN
jgi:hypothetical protein